MEKLKVGSLFAGVGGTCIGFKNAGFNVVWSNEIDKNAAITYRENFEDVHLYEGDIHELDPTQLPKVDVLLAGFPCQAFSIAGYRKGFEDDRGNLFFEVMRLARVLKPQVIFLENVKNLKSHDKGNTYKVIKGTLEAHGYYVKEEVLNSMEYGNVPQNRERIYIVAFKDQKACERFTFPDKIERTVSIRDVVDENVSDERYFYTPGKYPNYDEMINEVVHSKDTCYQIRRIYVRENKSNVCPTLTANMGTGGHNVPLVLTDKGVRKLTPRECFLLQGFPKTYKLPEKLAISHLYKQSGNSVTVTVIERIATNILNALLAGE
ncbi:DNA (cytosine-5-)-methyltransferase [Turicibacter sanguinis]|uniref:DNA cytosine methyltransferase n=1 Tax=Turicibacter sanguinis TaxID=154288 RepID=UPI0012B9981C|nr:DNA cytosine methyltransferase [Turicibacter sanguinis]MDB8541223.1 DNA cytosine methyltransferase [Turicibacter sanguinis]MTH06421.1 DNA (cytosine-5-)-methyltransferase [Turicibacter sanguinis]MTH08895.1 DNA (cytosine-5-)-methyltransferase [Turicibacter sanguinis]MTH11383.1 DNA (cytosine-5-)-methyltransferase [Turicibacter sanguinis]MTH21058.1 DNA (cytosine-5-)-methyltransferase [Turicibacter sanguinis]